MIFGFLLTTLFVPGIAGAAITPRWALLAIAMPILLMRSKSGNFTLAHLFGALFLTWSAISLIWTPNRLDGTGELIKLVILAQAFTYGSRVKSPDSLLKGMAIGLILSSAVLGISRWYPDLVLHSTDNAGLFVNSGSLAEIAALVLTGLVYERGLGHFGTRWVHLDWGVRTFYVALIIALLPCIILPQSRGAWLALAAAAIVYICTKSKSGAIALVALLAILITYSLHLGFHLSSVTERLGIWNDAVHGLTWLGHGLGSFWTDFAPLSTTLDIYKERPEHLHNDALEIVFEGGLVGAVLVFGCVLSAVWGRSNSIGCLILAGFAAESFVGFPLHNPCTAFLAALCLGHLARDGASLRDVFDAGRILLRGRQGGTGRTARHWGLSPRCAVLSTGSQVQDGLGFIAG